MQSFAITTRSYITRVRAGDLHINEARLLTRRAAVTLGANDQALAMALVRLNDAAAYCDMQRARQGLL